MDTEAQNKYRSALIEKYEQRAWECLALYSYYGEQYSNVEKQLAEKENLIKVAEADIRNIQALPDHHTVENKNKVKGLKEDCVKYEKFIENVSPLAKTLYEKAATYQEESGRALEIVARFQTFKVKTPDEIAEAKKESKQ